MDDEQWESGWLMLFVTLYDVLLYRRIYPRRPDRSGIDWLLEGETLEGFGVGEVGGAAGILGAATPGCGEGVGIGGLAGVGEAGGDLGIEARGDVYIVVGLVGAEEPDFGDGVGAKAFVADLLGEVEGVAGVGIGGVEGDATGDAVVAMGGVGRPGMDGVVCDEEIRAMEADGAHKEAAQVRVVF